MIDTKTAPYAALLLRLTLGGLFLIHASLKIFVFTPAGTAQFFQSIGLPGALAYITILWEVAGGVALILGLWPRLVSLAMIPVLLGAMVTVHWANGFFFSNPNGGWEYLAVWIIAQLALTLIGDGALALKPGFFGAKPTPARA
jgi:putative oxidoreductase